MKSLEQLLIFKRAYTKALEEIQQRGEEVAVAHISGILEGLELAIQHLESEYPEDMEDDLK